MNRLPMRIKRLASSPNCEASASSVCKVHRQTDFLLIGYDDVSVVAIALKIDNLLDVKSDEFIPRIEIDSLLCHW